MRAKATHLDGIRFESRYLRNEVQAALALLLLQFEGDAPHWATLDALHEVLHTHLSA